eukprot:1314202-Alexandrium_andersonii.AAC.1
MALALPFAPSDVEDTCSGAHVVEEALPADAGPADVARAARLMGQALGLASPDSADDAGGPEPLEILSLIHISEPTRLALI